MPSAAHEVPLQVIQDNPAILIELLRKLGRPVPDGPLVPDDANLRYANPAEVRPDLVFRAERPRWLLVELQNQIDEDKGKRWLLAAAIKYAESGSMGELIVITSSRRVASWARKEARARGELGSVLRLDPVVVPIFGKAIEVLLDEAHPELSFFAAWAVRGRTGPEAREVIRRANVLTNYLPEPLQEGAQRAILAVLRDPLAEYFREIAMNPDQLPETSAARRVRKFFEERGKAEGFAEGKIKGRIEGKIEGEIEGEIKGEINGKRKALLLLLETRGLHISDEARATIAACSDHALLDRWIVQTVAAGSVEEVLQVPSARAER